MVTLNIGEIEFDTKADIVNTLNEIENAIESGCRCGITIGGVCWEIEGQEEPDDDDFYEDEDDLYGRKKL